MDTYKITVFLIFFPSSTLSPKNCPSKWATSPSQAFRALRPCYPTQLHSNTQLPTRHVMTAFLLFYRPLHFRTYEDKCVCVCAKTGFSLRFQLPFLHLCRKILLLFWLVSFSLNLFINLLFLYQPISLSIYYFFLNLFLY